LNESEIFVGVMHRYVSDGALCLVLQATNRKQERLNATVAPAHAAAVVAHFLPAWAMKLSSPKYLFSQNEFH